MANAGFLRRFARAWGKVITSAIVVYGLTTVLCLLLRILIGEQWAVIGLANNFLHLLLIPSLVLLPLCALFRRRRLLLGLVPAGAGFILLWRGLFLPRAVAATRDATPLKILTFNIHSEDYFPDEIATILQEADADIVAIQELGEPAARHLARAFAVEYPYQALYPDPNPVVGQGILSRFPILGQEQWRNWFAPIALTHQYVELDVRGIRLAVYNAHPAHPAATGQFYNDDVRGQEIDVILEKTKRHSGPVVMVGDFNMTDQADDYQRITARFRDAYREVGWGLGPTFPDWRKASGMLPDLLKPLGIASPFLRLDFVFHSDSVQALEAYVWHTSGGSDHRPLLVRLAIKEI